MTSYRLGEQLLKGGLDGVPGNPLKHSIHSDPVPSFLTVVYDVLHPKLVKIHQGELALQQLQREVAPR